MSGNMQPPRFKKTHTPRPCPTCGMYSSGYREEPELLTLAPCGHTFPPTVEQAFEQAIRHPVIGEALRRLEAYDRGEDS